MIRARFKINTARVSKDIDRFVTLIQQKIALQILEGVVNMNPVLSGRSRGNWYATIGAPSGQYDEAGYASSAQEVVDRGTAVISALAVLGAVYITNNTPYINELEKGSSKQAPQGMVQVTLDRLGAQF